MDLEVLERILDGREKPTNLSFELLKNITENFSDDREIGHGGFATVYKGVLPNGNVAVKRIKNSHSINETFFYREVDSLLNIEHKNVVRFLGFCASTDQTAIQIKGSKQHIYAEVRERLLCFEYISKGSLQKYITDELRGLEWNTRYKIIRGICEGLHHLHKEKQIYHMDLKPDNILLDNDMVPKITDFGLSRLDEKSKTMSEERHGSLGYCAPEYLHQGKMSFKSDMYSLGVIIIELVTGQKAIPNNNNNVLRRWRHRWKKTGNETPLVYQQVAKCLEIGLLCQEIDPSKRPYIWHLIHVIREIEGANEKISHAYEHTFGQISPYSEDDMLGIEPLQLHFLFELNKQMSCALQLTNGTDSYIAFNIENTSPLSYFTQPEKGIMPPQSMCSVEITMQLQGKAPGYMHRANELIVWSTKVNDCLVVEDITTNMFINEAVNVVDDVNLDVVFDVSEPQEASEETSVIICYKAEAENIKCIDASQTEPLIITGHYTGYVKIWTYDTELQKVVASIKVSEENVSAVKFIARMRWLVAVSNDCFLHVYKYETELEKVTSFEAHGYHDIACCSLDVHPIRPYVLSGCHNDIKLWDWDQDWNCIQTFEEHSSSIYELKFNPEDTNSFASASDDRTVKVWSLDSPKSKYTLSGHFDAVDRLIVCPSHLSFISMAAKMAKNVDKPLFTATFNVQGSSADYVTFITFIRNKLRNPGQSSHNRPVLPPVDPKVPPSRWFHIVLKTSPASTGLTLATRADNLYWEGFKSSDGTWWELTPGLIPGATYVGFGGTYRDLLGDTDKLTNVALGRQQMADAVTALYGRTKADKTSGPKQQQAREAVTTLLLMVHEATRFQTMSGFVAGLLHPKAVEKKSGKIGNEMKAQVNGWQDLSEALLKTDAKPPPGKPPAKFTPIEKMGVRTAEQAAATLGSCCSSRCRMG